MKETTFEDRINFGGRWCKSGRIFVRFSSLSIRRRRRSQEDEEDLEESIHSIWQGFCSCVRNDIDNDAMRMYESRIVVDIPRNEIPVQSWPILHQLGNHMETWNHLNCAWRETIYDLADTLAENLRVTLVNDQGRLIVTTTGSMKDVMIFERGRYVTIRLLPMYCDHDDEPEHMKASLDIVVDCGKIRIMCSGSYKYPCLSRLQL